MAESPRLYVDLASWFPLLSPPSDYAEEAGIFRDAIVAECATRVPRGILELGSGAGSNASYLKEYFKMTLVDLSEGMLDVSRKLNPECEHVCGDMRTIRLGREFDAVFVHDAVSYIVSREDLRAVMDTAYEHCAPGGAAIFAPDFVKENFEPGTNCGGENGLDRALRYLEWRWDPDPSDETYIMDMAYLLRDQEGNVEVVKDRHIMGLFSRATWFQLLEAAGFEPCTVPFDHSSLPFGMFEMIVGRRRVR